MYKYSFFLLLFLASCTPEEVTTTFEDGTVKEIYTINKEGLKDGMFKQYRKDGSLLEESEYEDDKLSGTRKMYFPDGKQVEIEELYKDDVMVGKHVVYYPNGAKLIESNFVDGKMTGILTKYFEDGNIMEVVTFEDNVEQGPFKEYYANGQVQWDGNYLNGDKEFGLLTQFDESGQLIKKMMCDSLGVCQTIWTPEKGDIDPEKFTLTKPEH